MTRCKFRLDTVNGNNYTFCTVYDPTLKEDVSFNKATPNGRIEMQIDNPLAQSMFVVGNYYYFDASPVPPAEAGG